MANTLIIDNWQLQDIGNVLANGLSADTASELVINPASDSHHVIDVPHGGVQIEALLALLVDIVLRESIVVDSKFAGSWEPFRVLFRDLINLGLIRPLDFGLHGDRLVEPTQYIVQKLCLTTSLKEVQRKNEESWSQRQEANDRYMSQVVWGTAGMLSRSHVFEAPYSGHPLRRRLLEQSMMTLRHSDEVGVFNEWVAMERIRLYETRTKDMIRRQALLVLPPIAVDVINESNAIHQLIPVALQHRDKYRKLREWLGEVQSAVDTEDAKRIAKNKRTLDAVAKDIQRTQSASDAGGVSLKITVGWPSLNISLPTFHGVLRRFGMRATLGQQIFSPRGDAALRKLMSMFGEGESQTGLKVREYLSLVRKRHGVSSGN
jgi:hypothetical protein